MSSIFALVMINNFLLTKTITNMEVITIESKAFKDLTANINTIAKFIEYLVSNSDEVSIDGWVDSYEVCTFMKISDKTLQRLRTRGEINFSKIRGKNFYLISEIERLMKNNIIRRSEEHLCNLMMNYKLNNNKLHAKKRYCFRKN